ncbi:MAG: thioredoxin fold domain-containing protein [Solirubrobacterales bacterium]|nr:thioredoxin fold domain-containing protein [Solirubrobacterales bacterium]
MVKDVDEATFKQEVIERSREVPVVVDFWAEWCGPCRTLGPAIEQAVAGRDGKVELAKVDVDANQQLAAAFRVQGIPAVKAFRNGEVVDEFTGALPPAQIEAFLDRIVPSAEEEAAKAAIEVGDEEALRAAVAADPNNPEATAALARLLLSEEETTEAEELTEALAATDFVVAGLNARARLAGGEKPPAEAFKAWDSGDHEFAFDLLQKEVELAATDPDRRDLLRKLMVGYFTELGPTSELAATHRRRLSTLLS